MQRRDLDRGSSVVCFCGRHDRTKADEDPDEGTAAVGSADASSRITSRLGDAILGCRCASAHIF